VFLSFRRTHPLRTLIRICLCRTPILETEDWQNEHDRIGMSLPLDCIGSKKAAVMKVTANSTTRISPLSNLKDISMLTTWMKRVNCSMYGTLKSSQMRFSAGSAMRDMQDRLWNVDS
jgi:hypothetical protein